MIKRFFITTALVFGASLPSAVYAQTGGVCAGLKANWDRIEKNLAANLAEGVGDRSAPRATNRNIEDLTSMQEASLTYEMMRANKCPLPTKPPSASTYLTPALDCATARLRSRAADTPECRREDWQPSG